MATCLLLLLLLSEVNLLVSILLTELLQHNCYLRRNGLSTTALHFQLGRSTGIQLSTLSMFGVPTV